MTNSKTLIQRIATAISTADGAETYGELHTNEAKAALEETVLWLKEKGFEKQGRYISFALELEQELNK
jgi:hypothetical protein